MESSSLNDSSLERIAGGLDAWFVGVLELCDASVFAVSEQPAHRKAAALAVLTRNARFLRAHEMDHKGSLYAPTCFALAAGCRLLGVRLGATRWRAAVLNVFRLRAQLATVSLPARGLNPGTAASVFRDQFDEALIHAGVTDRPTLLDPHNREIALGLSVNWGLRFLLAYALECDGLPAADPAVHDLRWLRELLRSP